MEKVLGVLRAIAYAFCMLTSGLLSTIFEVFTFPIVRLVDPNLSLYQWITTHFASYMLGLFTKVTVIVRRPTTSSARACKASGSCPRHSPSARARFSRSLVPLCSMSLRGLPTLSAGR